MSLGKRFKPPPALPPMGEVAGAAARMAAESVPGAVFALIAVSTSGDFDPAASSHAVAIGFALHPGADRSAVAASLRALADEVELS